MALLALPKPNINELEYVVEIVAFDLSGVACPSGNSTEFQLYKFPSPFFQNTEKQN